MPVVSLDYDIVVYHLGTVLDMADGGAHRRLTFRPTIRQDTKNFTIQAPRLMLALDQLSLAMPCEDKVSRLVR